MCCIFELIFNYFFKVNHTKKNTSTKNIKTKIYPNVNSPLHEFLDDGKFIDIKL